MDKVQIKAAFFYRSFLSFAVKYIYPKSSPSVVDKNSARDTHANGHNSIVFFSDKNYITEHLQATGCQERYQTEFQ